MTREEAIKHIENIMPYVGENTKNSLDMAIKALETKLLDLEGLKNDMKALNCGYPYGLDYLLDCLKTD